MKEIRIDLEMRNGLIIHEGNTHRILYDNQELKELDWWGDEIDPPIIQDGIIIHTIVYAEYGFDLEYSLLEDYLVNQMIGRKMLCFQQSFVGSELSGKITATIEVEQSREQEGPYPYYKP